MERNLQQTIVSLIEKILREQGDSQADVAMDARISDLGVSSLVFAELTSELEQMFGVDPFDGEVSITDIVTVRDLVAAYTQHAPA